MKTYNSYEEYFNACFPNTEQDTCKGCLYFKKCKQVFNLTGEETKCSWFPRSIRPSDMDWIKES